MFQKAPLPLTLLLSTCSALFALSSDGTEHLETRQPDSGISVATDFTQDLQAPVSDYSLHKGWPVDLSSPGAGFPYTPTLSDIDGDGADEIFMVGGNAFGLSGDGNFLPGWPATEQQYMGYATNGQMPGPSCADMEGNGSIEILWSERDWYAGSAHMWTFNGRNSNGTSISGFPESAPDESSNALASPFVLGDSDQDGNLEAWTAHTLGNTGDYYRISCKDHLGNLNFTTDLDPSESILNLFFGDADGNGAEEFFAVSMLAGTYRLHMFTSTGEEQPGYPVNLFSPGSGNLMFGPPIAADLDKDGDLEMIMGYYVSSTSYAVARHHDGSSVEGFPIIIATASQLFYLGLGDVTADGSPELIAIDNHLSADYRVHVLDITTGSHLTGWPVAQADWPEGFPTVVDVNGDAIQDICFVTNGGELFALSADGSVISGYPKTMSSPSVSGVSAGDIDGDGFYELVAATWDGFVYAWDTEGELASGTAEWPMRGVDASNTGVYYGTTVEGIEESPQQIGLSITNNPVRNIANFTVVGSTCSSISIFDISGKRITEINSGNNLINWVPAEDISNGVYFARLSGQPVLTLKFMLIR